MDSPCRSQAAVRYCTSQAASVEDNHWAVAGNRVALEHGSPYQRLRLAVLWFRCTCCDTGIALAVDVHECGKEARAGVTDATNEHHVRASDGSARLGAGSATGEPRTSAASRALDSTAYVAAGTGAGAGTGSKSTSSSSAAAVRADASVRHRAGACCGVPVVVQLNPTDARGHRCLVTVTDVRDPRATFNRPATAVEEAALGAALGFLRFAFRHELGGVAQTFVAGNNAHGVEDISTGTREACGDGHGDSRSCGAGGDQQPCGERKTGSGGGCASSGRVALVVGARVAEPSLVHGHVLLRGPPGWGAAESGLHLTGPVPGEEFHLKGPKVPYESAEQQDGVVRALRRALLAPDVLAAAAVFQVAVQRAV